MEELEVDLVAEEHLEEELEVDLVELGIQLIVVDRSSPNLAVAMIISAAAATA